jgi:hypothetical protein
MEWGGSSIIEENKYAMDLVEEFKLDLRPPQNKEGWIWWTITAPYKIVKWFLPKEQVTDDLLVIWDSDKNQPAFEEGESGLFNKIRLAYNFGILPGLYTKSAIGGELKKFVKVYELQENGFTYDSPHKLLEELDMRTLLDTNFYEYINKKHWVDNTFIESFLDPILRVNYMQHSRQMSAFGGVIGTAGLVSDFFTIRQGAQSFSENMLKQSGANVQLNATVKKVTYKDGKYTIRYNKDKQESFDFLIIASPIEHSNIEFEKINWSPMAYNSQLPKPYVQGHTTIIACSNVIPKRLGLADHGFLKNGLPKYVFSVLTKQPQGPFSLPFNVLGYGGITKRFSDRGHLVFKMFSNNTMSDDLLKEYFSDTIYVSRVHWSAPGNYPILPPNPVEVPTILDRHNRLFYVNAMESVISTMETTLIQSKNVSMLIGKELK